MIIECLYDVHWISLYISSGSYWFNYSVFNRKNSYSVAGHNNHIITALKIIKEQLGLLNCSLNRGIVTQIK